MSLADTGRAIGSVSGLLAQYLGNQTGLGATIGRPQSTPSGSSSGGTNNPRLNLFLYEGLFDPGLKNLQLDEGQPPPLWLVLKYLLTSFDQNGDSDSVEAHEKLGEGLRALQELNYLFLSSAVLLPTSITQALASNPEVLKITFNEATPDLISKLMQGTGNVYRFSVGFQVRPIMIAPREGASYSTLVGVDNTQVPPATRGDGGIQIPIIPSMGPTISAVTPLCVPLNGLFTIEGTSLNLSDLVVSFGGIDLPIVAQRNGSLRCHADVLGRDISAGTHTLCAVQLIQGLRRRSSKPLFAALRPTVTSAVAQVNPDGSIAADIRLTGDLLGRAGDDIFVALEQDGRIVGCYDGQEDMTPARSRLIFPANAQAAADQSSLTLQLRVQDGIPLGLYRVILRVNGQQAAESPTIDLDV